MNIKVHSSELNRMLKTIVQCIDPKSRVNSNIEISHNNNLLTIRATNDSISAIVSTPLLGGDGESFCVDGTMFARVCAMCNGEVTIATDGKICSVKGAGRTRLPLVDVNIPAFSTVKGKEISIRAEAFAKGYNSVSYAVSQDQTRIQLTGVLIDSTDTGITMVSLDGFKMAVEDIECESQEVKVVVPSTFMKLITISTCAGETIKLRTNGKRIQAVTDCMTLSCGLLSGDFPDYKKILPQEFKTESLTYADSLLNTLKCGSVVNTSNNLVKLNIQENSMTVMSNSEQADFDAEVNCITRGDELKIAFNHKFLMESISSIVANEITMKFNTPVSPCIISGKDCTGLRLILPVRVAG